MMKIDDSKLFDISKIKYNKDIEFDRMLVYATIQAEIAKELVSYRKNNNLTQIELAKRVNVNQSMIAKLERGDYNPSIKFLFDLSLKLDDNYDFFIKVISKIKKIIVKENISRFSYDDNYEISKLKVSEKKEEYKTKKPRIK